MMSERCWCELELVAGYVKDARQDHPARGCPVHGRNWQLSQDQVIALAEAVKAIGESVREAEAAEDAWVDAKALDHIGNIAQAVLDGLPKPEEVLEGEDLDDNAGQT